MAPFLDPTRSNLDKKRGNVIASLHTRIGQMLTEFSKVRVIHITAIPWPYGYKGFWAVRNTVKSVEFLSSTEAFANNRGDGA
jgi:hypothetical protein